jgi:PncC family amidohydrolase
MDDVLLARVSRLLAARSIQVATAESCTGGLLAKLLTDVAGSSAYVKGGVVAYSNDVKERVLGVRGATLARYGAVSAQTVREMAEGARSLLGADVVVAISGVAGPGGGSAEKPVGTVFLDLYDGATHVVEARRFGGDRDGVRTWSAQTALQMLERWLLRPSTSAPSSPPR